MSCSTGPTSLPCAASSTIVELAIRLVQRMLLGGGLALMLLSVATLTAGEIGRRSDIENFPIEPAHVEAWRAHTPPPDMSLWSTRRVQDFKLAETAIVAASLACLGVSIELVRRVRKLRSLMSGCVAGPSGPAAGGELR